MIMTTKIQYKKEKINATVSPYLKKRIDELVEKNEFSSISDFVSIASAYFLSDYDSREESTKKKIIAESIIENKNDMV